LTYLSICRDVSATADDLGANREAFVITAVITPHNSDATRSVIFSSLIGLAEGEHVGLGARIDEGDLEGAVGDRAVLTDQLVEPRIGNRSVAWLVDVDATCPIRGVGCLNAIPL
jgi:hypothetical protein